MNVSLDLQHAVDVYFDARSRMYAGDPAAPDFHVFQSATLRGFHRHPGWFEQDNFYVLDTKPKDVIAEVNAYNPHPHHMITVFADSIESQRASYTAFGYKEIPELLQPFLRKRLDQDAFVASESRIQVRHVRTPADLAMINSGGEVVKPYDLNHDFLRYNFIEQGGQVACTGSYVLTPLSAIYVGDIETHAAYRRQGLATALIRRMHLDAVAEGAKTSVLVSHASALEFYKTLGYEVLANMYAFVPNVRVAELT